MKHLLVNLYVCAALVAVSSSGQAAGGDARGKVIATFARGSGPNQLGITDAAPDAPPTGPSGLVDATGDGVLILDAVNARIIRVAVNGNLETAAVLDANTMAQDIVRRGGGVWVLRDQPEYVGNDTGSGKLVGSGTTESSGGSNVAGMFEANGAVLTSGNSVLESSGTASGTGAWMQGASATGSAVEYRVVHADGGRVNVEVRQGMPQRTVMLRLALSSTQLGTLGFLGSDNAGRLFLRVEQAAALTGAGRVKVWVLRYQPDGRFDGGYDVPDDTLQLVPNRYLAVTGTGSVYFMESRRQDTRIWLLASLSASTLQKRLARADASPAPVPVAAGTTESAPAATGLTRAQILATAESYRTLAWTLQDSNYRADSVSACEPAAGKRWKRPAYLQDQQGKRITGVPYNWGGYMSIQQFLARLAGNAPAGNVCTCRTAFNCVDARAAGVDCSGFVSQTWGIGHNTTVGLMNIGKRLTSYKELKPGDALDAPNSHVRLFVANSVSGNGAVRAYEASTSCGKVCVRDFTTKQLEGYRPLGAPARD